jgi:hypothetical protein
MCEGSTNDLKLGMRIQVMDASGVEGSQDSDSAVIAARLDHGRQHSQ